MLRPRVSLAIASGVVLLAAYASSIEAAPPVKPEPQKKFQPRVWPKRVELCSRWHEIFYNCFMMPTPKYYPSHEA